MAAKLVEIGLRSRGVAPGAIAAYELQVDGKPVRRQPKRFPYPYNRRPYEYPYRFSIVPEPRTPGGPGLLQSPSKQTVYRIVGRMPENAETSMAIWSSIRKKRAGKVNLAGAMTRWDDFTLEPAQYLPDIPRQIFATQLRAEAPGGGMAIPPYEFPQVGPPRHKLQPDLPWGEAEVAYSKRTAYKGDQRAHGPSRMRLARMAKRNRGKFKKMIRATPGVRLPTPGFGPDIYLKPGSMAAFQHRWLERHMPQDLGPMIPPEIADPETLEQYTQRATTAARDKPPVVGLQVLETQIPLPVERGATQSLIDEVRERLGPYADDIPKSLTPDIQYAELTRRLADHGLSMLEESQIANLVDWKDSEHVKRLKRSQKPDTRVEAQKALRRRYANNPTVAAAGNLEYIERAARTPDQRFFGFADPQTDVRDYKRKGRDAAWARELRRAKASDIPHVTKIISGGQTGVDTAALEWAERAGLETGGFAPAMFNTEAGPEPEKLRDRFGLVETMDESGQPSRSWTRRTTMNVRQSDGTVWFGKEDSPGYWATKRAAEGLDASDWEKKARVETKYAGLGKPFIANPKPHELSAWLAKNRIQTLNVAGNRASTGKGYGKQAQGTLSRALYGTPDVGLPGRTPFVTPSLEGTAMRSGPTKFPWAPRMAQAGNVRMQTSEGAHKARAGLEELGPAAPPLQVQSRSALEHLERSRPQGSWVPLFGAQKDVPGIWQRSYEHKAANDLSYRLHKWSKGQRRKVSFVVGYGVGNTMPSIGRTSKGNVKVTMPLWVERDIEEQKALIGNMDEETALHRRNPAYGRMKEGARQEPANFADPFQDPPPLRGTLRNREVGTGIHYSSGEVPGIDRRAELQANPNDPYWHREVATQRPTRDVLEFQPGQGRRPFDVPRMMETPLHNMPRPRVVAPKLHGEGVQTQRVAPSGKVDQRLGLDAARYRQEEIKALSEIRARAWTEGRDQWVKFYRRPTQSESLVMAAVAEEMAHDFASGGKGGYFDAVSRVARNPQYSGLVKELGEKFLLPEGWKARYRMAGMRVTEPNNPVVAEMIQRMEWEANRFGSEWPGFKKRARWQGAAEARRTGTLRNLKGAGLLGLVAALGLPVLTGSLEDA